MSRTSIFKKIFVLSVGILIFTTSTFSAYALNSTVYTINDLKSAIYKQMSDRNTNFDIDYSGNQTYVFTKDSLAFVRSVYAGNDDYLEWNMDRISFNYMVTKNLIEIEFTAKYRTTRAQEIYVDENVNTILGSIIKPNMTDDEKLFAIHQYILDNVEYDSTLTRYTAYDALYYGSSVCQGYALLMDKMLEKAYIKTIIIDGSIPEGTHAWNLVSLNGIWYHVDATNDDVNENMFYLETDQFMQGKNYSWDKSLFPEATIEYKAPPTIYVDNNKVNFDVQPYINSDNRTMVPVRFISEQLGAEVYWDNNGQIVTIINGTDTIEMAINNRNILLNGQSLEMDTEAVLKGGRTMVPLRFISEYLGANVDWNQANSIINIYSK
jgi:transglutaminase-like putative cysteine protease